MPAVRLLILAALLAAAGFVVAGLVPGSGARLDHLAAGWIVLAVAAEIVSLLSYAVLFYGVFSGREHRLTFARAAHIALGELGAYVVLPSGVGGPVLRIWALLRSGMPFATQMVLSVIHAMIFNAPYVLAALILGTSVAVGIGPGHAQLVIALAPIGVVLATLSLGAGLVLVDRRLEG